mmetsp:Transcript_7702/g.13384  ORF Transcript_7702/g.13384 Transcript_7702/m.13384 type:complete len:213 (+) Transcript_7702:322-960(+)
MLRRAWAQPGKPAPRLGLLSVGAGDVAAEHGTEVQIQFREHAGVTAAAATARVRLPARRGRGRRGRGRRSRTAVGVVRRLQALQAALQDGHQRVAVVRQRGHQRHGVADQRVLHLVVQSIVSIHLWRSIHLDEPRLEVGVEEDVVPEQLKRIGLEGHMILHRHQALQNDLSHVPLQLVHIAPLACKALPQPAQSQLCATRFSLICLAQGVVS